MASALEVGSRFIASTMHEVRTPLQTIIGTLELLEETPLNKEQIEYIRQIEFSSNALLGLANDVLDFSKMNSDNFELEIQPFDVIELTERVVDLITVESFNRGLEVITNIDYDIPRSIMGDPFRIQQILLNLVKNASKYTDKGFIYVRLSMRKGGNALLFEVVDSGVGVPEDKKDFIFDDYYQVESISTRKAGGTGLGLPIAKKLVDFMKGRIGVLQNPSGGSNFWFTLPLERSCMNQLIAKKMNLPLNMKVLVVDDSILALKSTRLKLNYFGISAVDVASSCDDALEKLESSCNSNAPYAIVFIDLIMQGVDGWRVASEIKKRFNKNDMRLYLMVPEGQLKKEGRMKMLDWFNGYIYKPIKYKQLEELLLNYADSNFAQNAENSNVKESGADSLTENKVNSVLAEQIGNGMNVLVAEDQPINRLLLETFVKKYGAKVFSAENGQIVVDIIKQHPEIDLVFMDIFMPVKTGMDATIELRNGGYKGIIVACTANNDEADFKEYKKIGMNDIIVKPFKKVTIKECLAKWNSVLNVPNSKDMLSLMLLEKKSSDMWDIEDFMDTTEHNREFAISLMDEYIVQMNQLIENLKNELSKKDLDFSKIELYTHTMKGSSASVSAVRFAELGRRMNNAAKQRNLVELEEARINFEIDFITLVNIIENWKNSI